MRSPEGPVVISFPGVQTWDGKLEAVNFLAQRDGRTIVCSITREALERQFGPGAAIWPLECFSKNRPQIESMAARLISAGRYEADGSVVICQSDQDEPRHGTPG